MYAQTPVALIYKFHDFGYWVDMDLILEDV